MDKQVLTTLTSPLVMSGYEILTEKIRKGLITNGPHIHRYMGTNIQI